MRKRDRQKPQTDQRLEENIKYLYQQEAEKMETPDGMWEEICRRTSSGKTGEKGQVRLHRRRLALLVAAMVLLLESVTCIALVRRAQIRGYVNVAPDSTDFGDFHRIAKDAGYPDVKAVETFSNGFSYQGIQVGYEQDYDTEEQKVGEAYKTLNLAYRLGQKRVDIAICPEREITIDPDRITAIHEWDGVTVYQTIYVHFEMPLDWEDKITEEQRRLLEEGIAGAGVDSYRQEIVRYDLTGFQWQQDGCNYYVSKWLYSSDMDVSELETIAREMVEANN